VRATALIGPAEVGDSVSTPAVFVAREAGWVAALKDGRMDLVDGKTGAVRQVRLPGKAAAEKITGVGFSDDGRRLMISGSSKSIHSLRTDDLKLVQSLELSTNPSKRRFYEIEGGRIIQIEGRRVTGQGLFLRASKTRQGPVTHGIYRHEKGDFKLLWKREAKGLDLSAMAGNGKCLILAGTDATRVVDPVTGKDIAGITSLAAPITAAAFSVAGTQLISGDGQGRTAVTPLPAVCASR
jgi:hypothetical protein